MTSVQLIEAEQFAYRLSARPKDGTFFAKDKESIVRSPHLVNPSLAVFKESDLLYDSNSPQFRSREGGVINKFVSAEGNSEMSHLLLAIYFFVRAIPKERTNVDVVFVGIHPANHIDHLMDLFPQFDYFLYEDRFDTAFRKLRQNSQTDEALAASNQTLKRAELYTSFKHEDKMEFHRQRAESGRDVYLIADYRNRGYGTTSTADQNSAYIAKDMKLQLDWARGTGAKYSLLRFKPQDKSERTAQNEIVDDLRIMYPVGRFLKLSMAEQKSAFLICNEYGKSTVTDNGHRVYDGYKGLQEYYHDDMIGMIDHQNKEVATTMLYMNPFDRSFNGYITAMDVELAVLRNGYLVEDNAGDGISRSRSVYPRNFHDKHICGMGWHHRAMLYIITMLLASRGETYSTNDTAERRQEYQAMIRRYILDPWLKMEVDKKSSGETTATTNTPSVVGSSVMLG